jgi:hypothetical protein
MKIAICLSIFIFANGAITVSAQNDIKLEVNAKLPAKYGKKSNRYIATAASQMFPFVEISIKKVNYLIAFDEHTRKIKYIYTSDKDFIDADGRKVGSEITLPWDKIDVLGYFQLRGPEDQNGWQPVVGYSEAFEGDFLERVKKAGQLTATIGGFAKGYNY